MIGTKYTITERNKIQRKKRINRQKKAIQTFRRKPFDVLGYMQDKYGIEGEKQ